MEYKECPCDCGYTHENEPDKFEFFQMKMGSIMGQELPTRKTLRCATCKKVSILKRIQKNSEQDLFEGLTNLKSIIDKKQNLIVGSPKPFLSK